VVGYFLYTLIWQTFENKHMLTVADIACACRLLGGCVGHSGIG